MDNMWILQGKTPVKTTDVIAWGRQFQGRERIIAKTRIGEAEVSTVFLCIDHGFGTGLPILFETMVFGGTLHETQDRCTTYDGAEALHKQICEDVRSVRASEVLAKWNRRVSARERKVNESVTFGKRIVRLRKKNK